MSELLPEPTLPIFGEKTVFYTVVHPRGEMDSRWETVKVPVDEIDTIEDSRFRDALWRQFNADETKARFAVFLFVNPEGKYTHAVSVPRRPLELTFASDGVIENEDLPAYREQKSLERGVKEQKSASWLMRLFKK